MSDRFGNSVTSTQSALTNNVPVTLALSPGTTYHFPLPGDAKLCKITRAVSGGTPAAKGLIAGSNCTAGLMSIAQPTWLSQNVPGGTLPAYMLCYTFYLPDTYILGFQILGPPTGTGYIDVALFEMENLTLAPVAGGITIECRATLTEW